MVSNRKLRLKKLQFLHIGEKMESKIRFMLFKVSMLWRIKNVMNRQSSGCRFCTWAARCSLREFQAG